MRYIVLIVTAVSLLLGCTKSDDQAPRSRSMAVSAMPQPSVDTSTTVKDSTATTEVTWFDTTKLSADTTRFRKGRARITDAMRTTTRHIKAQQILTDSTWFVVSPVARGVPFGPYRLWASSTSLNPNASAFTASLNSSDPSTIVAQINAARTKGHRLVLSMTACCRAEYLTNGNFTLSKWKLRQDRYNTPVIKTAVATGVSDGTVIGDKLLDEPENGAWGTGLDKAVVDQMAAYTKAIFPTLPVGVSHGAGGSFKWRTDQTYKVLDWVSYQYNSAIHDPTAPSFKAGDVIGWRTRVLAQAALDKVAVSFSYNLLDGGFRIAGCPVPQTGGPGTYSVNCRMIASQIREYGLALGPMGCMTLMWRYDNEFFAKADNQTAFRDVAAVLATIPRKSCRRAAS